MAIVTVTPTGVDFDKLVVKDLLLGDVTVATATHFTLRDGTWLDEFSGQFTYSNNQISGGTLTGWKESEGGETIFDVQGFSIPVTQFVTWVSTDNNEAVKTAMLAGDDTMTGSVEPDRMWGYAGNDTMVGGGGQDYLRGGEGNDSLSGGDAFDDLHGNQGDDTVDGGLGSDWVVGGQGNDMLIGGPDASDDVVYGNLGNDTCIGGGGIDWVRGGQGDDSLSAGAGNDLIWGDRGNDTIEGGAGADVFSVFGEAGIDRVLDFNRAEGDRVRVEAGYTYTTAEVGDDVVISISGGAQMTLVGVKLSALTGDWIFTG